MFSFDQARSMVTLWDMAPGNKETFRIEQFADILQQQSITPDSPGPILKDFQTMLDFLQSNEVPVSTVSQLLPLKCLPDLNQRFSRPTDIQLKRPVWPLREAP